MIIPILNVNLHFIIKPNVVFNLLCSRLLLLFWYKDIQFETIYLILVKKKKLIHLHKNVSRLELLKSITYIQNYRYIHGI